MRIGVDYYPEHWEKSLWFEDMTLMKKTGVSLVRLAEFAWSRLEPDEGRYTFDWLDEAIALFGQHGIKVVLGTPTATPPNWLVEKYPDVLPVDANLHPRYPGVRCHRCYNSPSLRRATIAFLERMTERYAQNSTVIGWQTDNEFAAHDCHCPHCQEAFRIWLKKRYSTLEELNRTWGTVVWSGEFNAWSQLTTPLGGSPQLNPSYLLDYYRFCTDAVVDFQKIQLEIIRRNSPRTFITHNIWGYPVPLDYYKLFADLDFATHDYYPDTNLAGSDSDTIYQGAFSHDLVRGVKRQNFWVMEQLSGTPGCWNPMGRAPYPGMIRAYSWQSISRGADTVVHFRWRSATIGAEQFWHGLIDHSNIPGRRFEEFRRLTEEVNRLAPLLEGTNVKNQIAILHSHVQHTSFTIQPQVEGMSYFTNLKTIHSAFLRLGAGTDVLDWQTGLEGYRLVVAPALYLLDEETAMRLADFAHNGGTLVLTNRTGVKNMQNVCWMKPLPGPLAECAGVTVEEYDPIGSTTHRFLYGANQIYECRQWCDILKPTTAEPVGWYQDDYFAGKPAITVNHYGKGKVYYLGVNAEGSFYQNFLAELLKVSGLNHFPGLPEGVEISIREKEDQRLLFILNLTAKNKVVPLDRDYPSALNDRICKGSLHLGPFEVEILNTQ